MSRCRSYAPGHTVHWIQSRLVNEFLYYFPERCSRIRLTDLGDGWFETVLGGEARRGWNHDASSVTAVVLESMLDNVLFVPKSGALVSAHHDGLGETGWRGILYPAWGEPGQEIADITVRDCVVRS
ncbi:MAG: hypothetical protein L0K27_06435 [Corynebacterium nuruki]|nr:hypothetical protein [Corynebacterium nuruki]